jgi:hypothetical protein
MKATPICATLMAAALMFSGMTVARADDGGKGPGANSGSSNSGPSNSGPGNGGATQVRLRTNLAGAAITGKKPEGNADFRNDGTRTRLNVEVENVNLPDGTVLTVQVTLPGGVATTVGTINLLAANLENELEIDSQNGGVVPAIVSGTMVTVLNGATVILAGVF